MSFPPPHPPSTAGCDSSLQVFCKESGLGAFLRCKAKVAIGADVCCAAEAFKETQQRHRCSRPYMDRSTQGETDDNGWFDVQSILQAAASQLQPGEMLQAEHFNLFEAMSAVEVGDPKMDAGLDTATAPTPDQLVEQRLAPLELSHQQLIAILDQLAAMQASWHVGNSLAQTVFVCLYMLKPDR